MLNSYKLGSDIIRVAPEGGNNVQIVRDGPQRGNRIWIVKNPPRFCDCLDLNILKTFSLYREQIMLVK